MAERIVGTISTGRVVPMLQRIEDEESRFQRTPASISRRSTRPLTCCTRASRNRPIMPGGRWNWSRWPSTRTAMSSSGNPTRILWSAPSGDGDEEAAWRARLWRKGWECDTQ